VGSKSLKLYLNGFRHGAFHRSYGRDRQEAVSVCPAMAAYRRLFPSRGGMPIDVFSEAGAPCGTWVPDQGVSTYRARSSLR
jgi:NADPH-dependent 7-cyano-7-deazaguanine reductase QueF